MFLLTFLFFPIFFLSFVSLTFYFFYFFYFSFFLFIFFFFLILTGIPRVDYLMRFFHNFLRAHNSRPGSLPYTFLNSSKLDISLFSLLKFSHQNFTTPSMVFPLGTHPLYSPLPTLTTDASSSYSCTFKPTTLYNTIQYKHEYYYSGTNPVEFRGPMIRSRPYNFHKLLRPR